VPVDAELITPRAFLGAAGARGALWVAGGRDELGLAVSTVESWVPPPPPSAPKEHSGVAPKEHSGVAPADVTPAGWRERPCARLPQRLSRLALCAV
jgi:hypothetical protein